MNIKKSLSVGSLALSFSLAGLAPGAAQAISSANIAPKAFEAGDKGAGEDGKKGDDGKKGGKKKGGEHKCGKGKCG